MCLGKIPTRSDRAQSSFKDGFTALRLLEAVAKHNMGYVYETQREDSMITGNLDPVMSSNDTPSAQSTNNAFGWRGFYQGLIPFDKETARTLRNYAVSTTSQSSIPSTTTHSLSTFFALVWLLRPGPKLVSLSSPEEQYG